MFLTNGMLVVDALFRNTDRHLSNIGILVSRDDSVRLAPMFDYGLALGLSDGAYWDIDNVVSGRGFVIKPYGVSACEVLTPECLSALKFSVVDMVGFYERELSLSLGVENKLFGAFLNILCNNFEVDCNGVNVREYLEERFGNFRPRRYKRR